MKTSITIWSNWNSYLKMCDIKPRTRAKILNKLFDELDGKRAFRYEWIAKRNREVLDELIKEGLK